MPYSHLPQNNWGLWGEWFFKAPHGFTSSARAKNHITMHMTWGKGNTGDWVWVSHGCEEMGLPIWCLSFVSFLNLLFLLRLPREQRALHSYHPQSKSPFHCRCARGFTVYLLLLQPTFLSTWFNMAVTWEGFSSSNLSLNVLCPLLLWPPCPVLWPALLHSSEPFFLPW